ncbi:baseplate protein [Paraburkholderia sp. Tr-20389]|uniref:baseplate J/gp47 family protein n=1 Tax=Paraburkholderia sp. Tr-20389 TaxID=2703903 RepID=UPI00198030F1|nr:baseplate J/gp47 family protein [Paraburkholderia sp. Tr-20389]MBN3757234.1 baseplate protein [Paraburkholderia sp. Tr-20389]
MANINTQSFGAIVTNFATAVQGAASQLVDFTIGSVLRAIAEAVAGVCLWIQGLILQLLSTTRLSTSSGNDVDTFVADFGLTREAAVAAVGQVTFSRFTPTNAATIPLGSVVQSADGTQPFSVIADTTQAYWNASANAYVIPAGITSGIVTVQAQNAGIQGNVSAGTITALGTAIPGIDYVSNANAFTSGVNAESDAALKSRFALYIQGLRQGTKSAVASAIAGLQQGIEYTLTENQTLGGATQYGFFYVVISPFSTTLQNQVYAAIDAIRPLSVTFAVYGATNLTANISVTVTVSSGYTHSAIATAVQSALQSFIATLQIGQTLYWSQLYSVIYAVAGVQEATLLQINSGTSDLVATSSQAIVAGTLTVN